MMENPGIPLMDILMSISFPLFAIGLFFLLRRLFHLGPLTSMVTAFEAGLPAWVGVIFLAANLPQWFRKR